LAGGLWGDYEQGQTIVAGLCRRRAAETDIRAIALFPVQAQFRLLQIETSVYTPLLPYLTAQQGPLEAKVL